MDQTSQWRNLLSPIRRKDIDVGSQPSSTAIGRKELERDYDRILFAAPTRRLSDKTQVYPFEINDSVRTRLTHSHEVSNLARSIGIRLAFEHADVVFGPDNESLNVKRNVPALLAAVGLAHDLGNPPFGHQGELAMQQWFEQGGCGNDANGERVKVAVDHRQFDGNAQTFRLLTRLQILNDQYGLNLCVATLAALLKYPSIYGSRNKGGYKKYGVFESEREIVEEVWRQTALSEGVRHPLAYIMEACDDIAYSVIDAEDTVKKGYASFYDLIDHLDSSGDQTIRKIVEIAVSKNRAFKKESLSAQELNDISMQMFRVNAISEMVLETTSTFIDNVQRMLDGTIPDGFALIENSKCAQLCHLIKEFDRKNGFQNKEVLRLELKGSNYIKSMMSMLWKGISKENDKNHPFERFVFGEISENYRRIYESGDRTVYDKCQLLCDALSGMTEKHLIKKHDEYKSLENAYS